MLSHFIKLLNVLNSETAGWQISAALVLALFIGIAPIFSPFNLIALLIVCLVRINISSFLLGYIVFSLIGILCSGLINQMGEFILTQPALETLFTAMYQSEFLRLLAFNHTGVMGALVVALGLAVPLYLTSEFVVRHYRQQILQWVAQLKIVKILKASSFYQLYQKFA